MDVMSLGPSLGERHTHHHSSCSCMLSCISHQPSSAIRSGKIATKPNNSGVFLFFFAMILANELVVAYLVLKEETGTCS
jgi:hypothetical protein